MCGWPTTTRPGRSSWPERCRRSRPVAGRLAAEGITTARLNAATGFHSPLVASASEPLLEFLRGADVRTPALDVYAGRDAGVYPADPDKVRQGLAAQIAEPVEFVQVIEAMYARGVRTFVEVGAGAALTGLASQILGQREHAAVSLDRRGQHGVTSLQDGLGRLAVSGLAMDFGLLWDGCAPVPESPVENRPAVTVRIDGGNYGRPYPPVPGRSGMPSRDTTASAPESPHQPALEQRAGNGAAPGKPGLTGPVNGPAPRDSAFPPAAAPPAAASAIPAAASAIPAVPAGPAAAGLTLPAGADEGWLRIIEDAQQQTAAAQAEFQRTMTESHLTYLRMAEATFAGLLGVGGGEVPAIPPSAALPLAGSDGLLPAASAGLPAAYTRPPAAYTRPPAAYTRPPAVDSAGPPAVAFPNGQAGGPAAGQDAAAPGRQDRLEAMDAESIAAMLLEVVADRTGYPVEMLNVDMELDTDLGIDSIKKVEILSTVRERIGDMPAADLSALATLRTLRAIAEQVSGAALGASPSRAETAAEWAGEPLPAASPSRAEAVAEWASEPLPRPARLARRPPRWPGGRYGRCQRRPADSRCSG